MKIQPTTNHLRMLASVKGELWMMNHSRVEEFALACLDAGERAGNHAEGFDLSDFYDLRQVGSIDGDMVAHIHIKGALMNKVPTIYEKLGLATKYQTIELETAGAIEAGAVGIVYHVDSPGGTVAGVKEAGAAIRNASIPTVAHCSGLACSAAYWLASQANTIVATESAEIGNVGAILSWADCSAFWKELGVEMKALVSEGADLKSTFHLEPDEAQLEFLQARINAAGEEFREAVQSGREAAGATVSAEVWRAGWYSGEVAGHLGLLDAIGSSDAAAQEIAPIK